MFPLAKNRIHYGYCGIIPVCLRFRPCNPLNCLSVQIGARFDSGNISSNPARCFIIASLIIKCLKSVDFIIVLLPAEFFLPFFLLSFPLCFFPLFSLYPNILRLQIKCEKDLSNSFFNARTGGVSNIALPIRSDP